MDKIDTDILDILINSHEPITSVDVVKELYCIETRQDMLRQVNKITYRLNKLTESGYIFCTQNDKNKAIFSINKERIKIGDSQLKIGDDVFDLGEACVILLDDGQILFLFDKLDL